jgi:predicted nucleic acid-binding Zn ribbon protein
MPTYVYQVITDDGSEGEVFEVVQSMHDDALSEHPETGEPVQRIIQPPNIGGAWSEGKTKESYQNNKRLGELGFTKYVKSGDGHYEKAAGKGPDTLNAD